MEVFRITQFSVFAAILVLSVGCREDYVGVGQYLGSDVRTLPDRSASSSGANNPDVEVADADVAVTETDVGVNGADLTAFDSVAIDSTDTVAVDSGVIDSSISDSGNPDIATFDTNQLDSSSVADADVEADMSEPGVCVPSPGPCTILQTQYTPDGEILTVWTLTYDERDNLLTEVADTYDDGSFDRVVTYTYDDEGRFSMGFWDYDGDERCDYRLNHTYDEVGNLILQESFNGLGGFPNLTITFTHDERGNALTERIDARSGPIFNRYGYDERDNRTMMERDNEADGTVDMRTNYTYDERDNLVLVEMDGWDPPDGVMDYRTVQTYDDAYNLEWVEAFTLPERSVFHRHAYDHDDRGNMLSEDCDQNGDGSWDGRIDYTYDKDCNLIMIEYDHDPDGTVDDERVFSYECW